MKFDSSILSKNTNMKLIQVTKNGTLRFKMSDGRLGISYPSGYVRVSVKGIKNKLYQINKQVKKATDVNSQVGEWHYVERQLVMCPSERYLMLLKFDYRNCCEILSSNSRDLVQM